MSCLSAQTHQSHPLSNTQLWNPYDRYRVLERCEAPVEERRSHACVQHTRPTCVFRRIEETPTFPSSPTTCVAGRERRAFTRRSRGVSRTAFHTRARIDRAHSREPRTPQSPSQSPDPFRKSRRTLALALHRAFREHELLRRQSLEKKKKRSGKK